MVFILTMIKDIPFQPKTKLECTREKQSFHTKNKGLKSIQNKSVPCVENKHS
jgi:hypothetical protein